MLTPSDLRQRPTAMDSELATGPRRAVARLVLPLCPFEMQTSDITLVQL